LQVLLYGLRLMRHFPSIVAYASAKRTGAM